jgi:hypothetical protein
MQSNQIFHGESKNKINNIGSSASNILYQRLHAKKGNGYWHVRR